MAFFRLKWAGFKSSDFERVTFTHVDSPRPDPGYRVYEIKRFIDGQYKRKADPITHCESIGNRLPLRESSTKLSVSFDETTTVIGTGKHGLTYCGLCILT